MDFVANSGFNFTLDEFEKYCNEIADTAAWGGQLEVRIPENMSTLKHHNPPFAYFFMSMLFIFSPRQLKALSQVLQLPIEVIQAESPSIIIGEEYDKPTITLV